MTEHYLNKLFAPRGIAVIGASRNPQKVGNAIVKNLLESGYKGNIYPVNPREEQILGLKCYKHVKNISLHENKQRAELAVIAIPAAGVLEAAKECKQNGIRFLIVVSAGFRETGAQGTELEKELRKFCREQNLHLLGPNCVGLMHSHTPVNASFARGFPQKGNIAFISQSGAMLVSIIDWSELTGLGFSHFVSLGNKANLSEIDFLEYAAWDPTTKVILCYLEDIVDGQRFLDVARKISTLKPIIILKSGASSAGARAVTSHTGALAGADKAYDAAFKQSAVLRAGSMEELFDMAVAFSQQPLPQGDKIAIVTNSGGPGILTTDQVEKAGLTMARFATETTTELRNFLPTEASIYNPVDVLGDANAERYRFALEKVLQDPGVDGVITLLCPTATTEAVEVACSIVQIQKQISRKPLLCVFMGGKEIQESEKILRQARIPCYNFPERAVQAIEGMVRYSRDRSALLQRLEAASKTVREKKAQPQSYNNAQAKAVFYDAIKERRVVLLEHEAMMVLESFGINTAPTFLTKEPDDAAEKAGQIGFPVVLKIASPKIAHKSDIGGVVTGLENSQEVKEHFRKIMQRARHFLPDAPLYGVIVQKMMPQGMETIIGSSFDLQFGPLLVFGLGGIYVNLFEDVSLRLAKNLDREDIKEMIRETKAYHLLKGFRGKKPLDLQSLEKVILNLSDLVREFPEIKEMDINPLLVYEKNVCAVDVKITLSHDMAAYFYPVEQHGERILEQLAERRT